MAVILPQPVRDASTSPHPARRSGPPLLSTIVALLLIAGLAGCGDGSPEEPTAGEADPLPGQLVVDSADPSWFRRSGGGAFYMCGPGDPEGFLYRGDPRKDGTRSGDQERLIEKLAGTGANAVYFMAVRSHGGDGDETENPFVDHDPDRGINPAVLDQWAGWIGALDRAGVTSFFILYDDNARVWDTGDRVSDEEREFVTTLVRRFRDVRHLIWVVAEEYSEGLTRERATRLADIIRAADGRGHPIAVHQLEGLEFDFEDVSAVDGFAIQYNLKTPRQLHDDLAALWHRSEGRYNLTLAEGNPAGDEDDRAHGTGREARLRNWATAMAGAYVLALGWDIVSTPVEDLQGCAVLVEFMEGTPLAGMRPRDDLAAGHTDYVLADPGRAWILYAAEAAGGLGVRDLPAGTYDMTWLDIPSGERVEWSGREEAGGATVWERPAEVGPESALRIVPTGG